MMVPRVIQLLFWIISFCGLLIGLVFVSTLDRNGFKIFVGIGLPIVILGSLWLTTTRETFFGIVFVISMMIILFPFILGGS